MLIYHFEAETQGFQGLIDQNDQGKSKFLKNHIFWMKHFFRGVPGLRTIENEGQEYPNAYH